MTRLGEEVDLIAGLVEEAGEDVVVIHRARARLFILLEHQLQGPLVQVAGDGCGRQWRWAARWM